jgi:chorismate mutase
VRSLITCLLLLVSAPAYVCTPGQLYSLMSERLSYMPAVAAYKAERGLPIVDIEREKLVVAKTIEAAARYGLPAIEAETFARAQITAAKQIQAREQKRGQLSLAQIREQLLLLGDAQLQSLACLRAQGWSASATERPVFARALHDSGLWPDELEALFQALHLSYQTSH